MSRINLGAVAIAGGIAIAAGLALKGRKPWWSGGSPPATVGGEAYGYEPCKYAYRLPVSIMALDGDRPLEIDESEAILTGINSVTGDGKLMQYYRRLEPVDQPAMQYTGDARALAESYRLGYAIGALKTLLPSLYGQTVSGGARGLSLEFHPSSGNLDKIWTALGTLKAHCWIYGRDGKAYRFVEGIVQESRPHELETIVRIDWAPRDENLRGFPKGV